MCSLKGDIRCNPVTCVAMVAASIAVFIVSDILIIFNQSIYFKLQRYLLPNIAERPDFTQKIMPESFATEILQKIENKSKQCENSCILYTGRTKNTGYGIIDIRFPGMERHIPMHVHRVRYMIHIRTLKLTPSEYHVSHLCHTRNCSNVSHLSFEPAHVNNARQNCFSEKRCTKHCPYPECMFI